MYTSGSLEDKSWAPLIELDAAYTYFPTYAQVLTEYNRQNFKPVFMVEANYEFENDGRYRWWFYAKLATTGILGDA